MITLNINGRSRQVEMEADTPLLWVLRDELDLKGTKFGCGAAMCGACTVHLDGEPVRSCVVPISAINDAEITTIEGIASPSGELHAVQKAWAEMGVPQCGYCQSGFIMAAVRLLKSVPRPTDKDIDTSITNLCRCGTYERIRSAIKRAGEIVIDE